MLQVRQPGGAASGEGTPPQHAASQLRPTGCIGSAVRQQFASCTCTAPPLANTFSRRELPPLPGLAMCHRTPSMFPPEWHNPFNRPHTFPLLQL